MGWEQKGEDSLEFVAVEEAARTSGPYRLDLDTEH